MSFLTFVPRDKTYLDYNVSDIPLKVLVSNGVKTDPNLNIKVTDLNRDGNNVLYKHFYNQGYGGITFKIQVILQDLDKITGNRTIDYSNDSFAQSQSDTYFLGDSQTFYEKFRVIDILNYVIENMIPVFVTTDALDVPNDLYIITGNPSRNQTHKGSTVWDLEFTTYIPLDSYKYKNDNAKITSAIKAAKKARAAKSNTTTSKKGATVVKSISKLTVVTTKTASTTSSKLAKCSLKSLKYSSKKKTNNCVKLLQKTLQKKNFYSGKIDGWFGSMTKTAVKKFQKKYKKKYKLKETGKVDKATLNALCKV